MQLPREPLPLADGSQPCVTATRRERAAPEVPAGCSVHTQRKYKCLSSALAMYMTAELTAPEGSLLAAGVTMPYSKGGVLHMLKSGQECGSQDLG